MTASLEKLISDAEKAGYQVNPSGDDLMIIKRVGRWRKPAGLIIFSDRTAFDISVDMEAAKGIRSYKDMRAALGI